LFGRATNLEGIVNFVSRASPASSPPLRDAMRHLVSGVCIITAGLGDDRTGMTVTSATSLSVAPPTMVVCVNGGSSVWQRILRYRHFCVSILAAHQHEIAERFAGRGGLVGVARFAGANWLELATGAPALAGALASIDCAFETHMEWHTHALVLGSVSALRIGAGDALVYSQRQYGTYPTARGEAARSAVSLAPGQRS
jgi:flavin reductase (DIM6/NTAB) family NADH-FMN oxidoreductase RutF